MVRLCGTVCQLTCGHVTFRWTPLNGNSKRCYSRLSVDGAFAAYSKIRALEMSSLCLRPHRAEALSDAFVWRLASVCLSVAYIGPNSRTERPRITEIGTEVARVTCDSDTTFKGKGQRSTCCWCRKSPICRNMCHLANKYEDIVNLQGRRHIVLPRAQLAAIIIIIIIIIITAVLAHDNQKTVWTTALKLSVSGCFVMQLNSNPWIPFLTDRANNVTSTLRDTPKYSFTYLLNLLVYLLTYLQSTGIGLVVW